MPEKSDQLVLSAYPFQVTEKLRYADTDRQGHINNAVFATLFESGRVPFLYDTDNPLIPDGTQFVIAELKISFLGEMNWPGEVQVGTGVSRLGNSSFNLAQAIFVDDDCVGTGQSVIVLIDNETRRATPLPEETRKKLAAVTIA